MSSNRADSGPMALTYRTLTIAILLVTTMVAFEAMAVTPVMPLTAERLGALSSYSLGFSLMLTGQLLGIAVCGIWCDKSGPAGPLLMGQGLFGIGSVLCTVAPNFTLFLIGRVVTGVASGLIMVALLVVIGQVYSESLRPKMFAWTSATWVLPSIVGAPIASGLTSWLGFRSVYGAVVIPAVIAAVMLGRKVGLIRKTTPSGRPPRGAGRRIAAYGGAVALTATAVQIGADRLIPHQTPWWAVILLIVGVGGLLIVVPRLLPRGTLLLRRGLPSVIASRFVYNAVFSGSLVYVSLFLNKHRGVGIGWTGGIIAAGAIGWALGSLVQGIDRLDGYRYRFVTLGAIAVASAAVAESTISYFDGPSALFALPLAVLGLGLGIGSTSLAVLSLRIATDADRGQVSTSLQLSDVLGSIIGIACGSAVFATLGGLDSGTNAPFTGVWLAMTMLGGLAIVAGSRCRR